MARTIHGYLKLDALRMGVPEQYAVFREGAAHVVEIVFDRSKGGLVARHRVTRGDGVEVTEWQCGEDVAAAREHFRREARALGAKGA